MSEAGMIRTRLALLGILAEQQTDLAHAARTRGVDDLALRFEAAAALASTEIGQLTIALRAALAAEHEARLLTIARSL